jgi:hypothetical protein
MYHSASITFHQEKRLSLHHRRSDYRLHSLVSHSLASAAVGHQGTVPCGRASSARGFRVHSVSVLFGL